jgi:NAD(P)H dehydrogenase (quinone)
MILVTGAGGKTGNAVIKALTARGQAVHAFVHREAHAESVRALGAAAISIGSLDNADAIARAAEGARAVYHICPNVSPFEFTFARAVVDGVSRAGVRRFIYHSVLHPQIEVMPHHWDKLRVEEMLLASGLDITILQPTAYMQNILTGWNSITNKGVYRVPYPAATRISLVDLNDVGEAASLVAASDDHIGATYELAGTAALSQHDVAKILGSALGKSIRVEEETPDAWAARARSGGMDDDQRDRLLKMFRYYERCGLVGNPNMLKWLLGREPMQLASFAALHANASDPTLSRS